MSLRPAPSGAITAASETERGCSVPDVLWKVFADPANVWVIGAMLVGLVGTVAGPWAIVRFAARQTRLRSED
jgi:hypothetical protein